jgi:hypothetical protein
MWSKGRSVELSAKYPDSSAKYIFASDKAEKTKEFDTSITSAGKKNEITNVNTKNSIKNWAGRIRFIL